MQLLNKNTDYAIRSLIVVGMNKEQEWVNSRAISEAQDIPLQFVRRILQDLVRADYLISKEGARGGVKLTKKAEDINLEEIITLYQGEVQLSECMFRKQMCPNRGVCALRKRINGIEQKVSKEFRSITLANLIADIEGG